MGVVLMKKIKSEYLDIRKANPQKLLDYGFKRNPDGFLYKKEINNGQFILKIKVVELVEIFSEMVENETGEIYTLHLTDSDGAFVGQIKEEYNNILNDIFEKCFNMNVFKYKTTYEIIDYIKEKYGDDVEYLWKKFPDNAVARRKDNKKWYLAILTVGKDKLGFETKDKVEVIDLRANPDEIPDLIKTGYIYPGYHMNKKHWISILLDGTTDIKEICDRIDNSYILAR